jgi:predicted HTH transcriptional regulator
MTQHSADILLRPESQTFERKRSLSLQREGLESLCAMINADAAQGTVVFGVEPGGQLVGVEPGDLDKAQRTISQTINLKFELRIQLTIDVVEFDGKRFVALEAVRNQDIPYHEFDGRAFIREGTVTRQLGLTEKQSLLRKRNRDLHTGPWTCDRCGAFVGMLSSIVITDEGSRKSYAHDCGGEFWPAA